MTVVATIPAYHVYYAPEAEHVAVAAWLDTCDAWDVSAAHEIRVEDTPDGLTVVYEAPCAGFSRHGRTYTRTRPCPVPPPPITTVPRPDLHGLFETHWPADFPLLSTAFLCAGCTVKPAVVPWPCPIVAAAADAVPVAA